MELSAQTVKWFKLSDELLDPLMSLGALTPSLKARFSLLSSFPPWWYRSCPWIRDAGAGDNGLDGFLLGYMKRGLQWRMEGWMDGWMLRGGLTQGLVKGRWNEGNKKTEKRRTHILYLFILRSSRPLWWQQRPVYCFNWVTFEPWAMFSLSSICMFLPLPPFCSAWLLHSVYLIPLSWFTLLRQTH